MQKQNIINLCELYMWVNEFIYQTKLDIIKKDTGKSLEDTLKKCEDDRFPRRDTDLGRAQQEMDRYTSFNHIFPPLNDKQTELYKNIKENLKFKNRTNDMSSLKFDVCYFFLLFEKPHNASFLYTNYLDVLEKVKKELLNYKAENPNDKFIINEINNAFEYVSNLNLGSEKTLSKK